MRCSGAALRGRGFHPKTLYVALQDSKVLHVRHLQPELPVAIS